METDLLTTREAAAMLGVGTSSVKRWADAGMVPCVRTPGGHRRIPREAVATLLEGSQHASPTDGQDTVDAWVRRLVGGTGAGPVVSQLRAWREQESGWAAVALRLGEVIEEIGRRWQDGSLSVLQEHLASERLARVLTQVAESVQVPASAPHAMLLMAPDDDHTLGLNLLEIVLREAGWQTLWVGRRTPLGALPTFLSTGAVSLVAVSASAHSADADTLSGHAAHLAAICHDAGVRLLFGGRGAWPDPPPYGLRLHGFQDLARHLAP